MPNEFKRITDFMGIIMHQLILNLAESMTVRGAGEKLAFRHFELEFLPFWLGTGLVREDEGSGEEHRLAHVRAAAGGWQVHGFEEASGLLVTPSDLGELRLV